MFGGRREAVLAWAKAFYSVFLRLAAVTLTATILIPLYLKIITK
jgi:hypothetical protein